jgi:hypothetical protein
MKLNYFLFFEFFVFFGEFINPEFEIVNILTELACPRALIVQFVSSCRVYLVSQQDSLACQDAIINYSAEACKQNAWQPHQRMPLQRISTESMARSALSDAYCWCTKHVLKETHQSTISGTKSCNFL